MRGPLAQYVPYKQHCYGFSRATQSAFSQVSNLRALHFSNTPDILTPANLEIGDIAGLETRATVCVSCALGTHASVD
jgi:hypothetical protein